MVRYAVWHGRMKSPLGCSIFYITIRFQLYPTVLLHYQHVCL